MLPSIFDTCSPRAEMLSGELKIDLFAAKLRLVVENKAPLVYQDANLFFNNTFPTDGLKTLLIEVFSRLRQKAVGSAVIRLETSFGGGKTHDEIAIWHICKLGRTIEGLERFVSLDLLPEKSIQVAAVDGRDLDPENGTDHADTGITTYTLWGEIAYQIGGVEGYQLLQGSDRSGIAPGSSVLERLIHASPTVIILDEIARYLRAAKAKVIVNSDLAEQVVAFLFTLMDLAASSDKLVLVYSLASVNDTFGEETNELREIISASARQERILKPSTDVDIYNIVKQRLFEAVDYNGAKTVAEEYFAAYRNSHGILPDGCRDTQYLEAIKQSYPFHPELFGLLTKKIAAIADFQKTRGALRLFAQVVRHLWQNQEENIYLIHTHHIPLGLDEDITSDLTSRLQRSQLRPAISADIYNLSGREAYAQVQDQDWIAAGKPPFSSWVARTIFLHSLTQGLSSGIRRTELNLSLLTPGLEIGFVERALQKLVEVAWYLDDDPITSLSRFKEEPSINKIVTEEKEQVGRTQAQEDLRARRDSIFAKKHFTLVADPESPSDVDDSPDDIVLCLIDFQEATINSSTDSPPELVEQIFNNTGEVGKFRLYKNRLLFLVANKQELVRAVDLAREHKAIVNILNSPNRLLDLSESQQKQLKERSGNRDLEVRVALTNTYRHLFYPFKDPLKAPKGLMHYVLPAQDAGNVKGKSNQQDVILKSLKDCQKIRPDELAKPLAPAYIMQKVWPVGINQLTTKGLKDTFAKDINLNILIDAEISLLRETIRQGLSIGEWDISMGDRLFIKTQDAVLTPPEIIEFSDRMELYRRGILQPPEQREIELSYQFLPGVGNEKSVRIRWKAKGSLNVTLYQDLSQVLDNALPSYDYETTIASTTTFKVTADYGNGEQLSKEIKVVLSSSVKEKTSSYSTEDISDSSIFESSPATLETEGTINTAFSKLLDLCSDYKVIGIKDLEVSVTEIMDYRKIGTSLNLLMSNRTFELSIDQRLTIQSSGQFVRLEYQGNTAGFINFFRTINTLLSAPDIQGDVILTLRFDFPSVVSAFGSEMATIKQALTRNPVERLTLSSGVEY